MIAMYNRIVMGVFNINSYRSMICSEGTHCSESYACPKILETEVLQLGTLQCGGIFTPLWYQMSISMYLYGIRAAGPLIRIPLLLIFVLLLTNSYTYLNFNTWFTTQPLQLGPGWVIESLFSIYQFTILVVDPASVGKISSRCAIPKFNQ